MIHVGGVASGRHVVANDQLRLGFASQLSILAYDQEYDAVQVEDNQTRLFDDSRRNVVQSDGAREDDIEMQVLGD